MDPTLLKPWLDMLVNYGVTLFITVGVFYFVWRYGTRWVESNILAQTQVPVELGKLNTTLQHGFDKVSDLSEDMHCIKAAIKHGAAAGEAVVGKKDTEAAIELRKMRESVDNGENA